MKRQILKHARKERFRVRDRKEGWWNSGVIDIKENRILIKGYRIQDLIGRVSYGEMLYLMIAGELSRETAGKLVEAVLVAVCDAGVVSPAVAATAMAATCGITFNSAVASGMNLLGEIHGGAIEEAMKVFYGIVRRAKQEERTIKNVALQVCKKCKTEKRYMPGYGHPLHTKDPRTARLWELAQMGVEEGAISGKYIEAAEAVHEGMKDITGKNLTINIDASAAALLCELGLPSEAASGFVCLSRGLGLVAHAYEELKRGRRMKAPMPPDILRQHMTYSGPKERKLPPEKIGLP